MGINSDKTSKVFFVLISVKHRYNSSPSFEVSAIFTPVKIEDNFPNAKRNDQYVSVLTAHDAVLVRVVSTVVVAVTEPRRTNTSVACRAFLVLSRAPRYS